MRLKGAAGAHLWSRLSFVASLTLLLLVLLLLLRLVLAVSLKVALPVLVVLGFLDVSKVLVALELEELVVPELEELQQAFEMEVIVELVTIVLAQQQPFVEAVEPALLHPEVVEVLAMKEEMERACS